MRPTTLTRTIAADHPERRMVNRCFGPFELRVDATHQHPIQIFDGSGKRVGLLDPGAAAHFLYGDTIAPPTLPAPIVAQLEADPAQAELDIPERPK